MVADPFSFPADLLLRHLNEHLPGVTVVGGMASGGPAPGESRLFHDDAVRSTGAVGMHVTGVDVRTLVSQGCRPVGSPYTVTDVDGPCGTMTRALASLPEGQRPTELIYCFDADGPGLAAGPRSVDFYLERQVVPSKMPKAFKPWLERGGQKGGTDGGQDGSEITQARPGPGHRPAIEVGCRSDRWVRSFW